MIERPRESLEHLQTLGIRGRVQALRGPVVLVAALPAPVGAQVAISTARGERPGEVVGFEGSLARVLAGGSLEGVAPGAPVRLAASRASVPVGEAMLGRLLDADGRARDGGQQPMCRHRAWLDGGPVSADERPGSAEAFTSGVRAFDALLPLARGQRVAVFSPAGAGKSTLLEMLARSCEADVVVAALIGERGREVRQFHARCLADERAPGTVVFAAASDEPAARRLRAARAAVATAEFFRDRGAGVLLVMDSLSRLTAARREVDIAAGELPAASGWTAGSLSMIPELLERCGARGTGAITAVFSVLAEAPDVCDALGEAVRAAADGHVWLSPQSATAGEYPAIDLVHSVSRLAGDIVEPDHARGLEWVRSLAARHGRVADLVEIGAYRGGEQQTDLAVAAMPWVRQFLRQGRDESAPRRATLEGFAELIARIEAAANRPERLLEASEDGLANDRRTAAGAVPVKTQEAGPVRASRPRMLPAVSLDETGIGAGSEP